MGEYLCSTNTPLNIQCVQSFTEKSAVYSRGTAGPPARPAQSSDVQRSRQKGKQFTPGHRTGSPTKAQRSPSSPLVLPTAERGATQAACENTRRHAATSSDAGARAGGPHRRWRKATCWKQPNGPRTLQDPLWPRKERGFSLLTILCFDRRVVVADVDFPSNLPNNQSCDHFFLIVMRMLYVS